MTTKIFKKDGLTFLGDYTIACKRIGTSSINYKINVYKDGDSIGYLLKEENIIKRMCKDYSFNVKTYNIDGYLKGLAEQLEKLN